MDFAVLKAELAAEAYTGLTDGAAAAALQARTIPIVRMRFGSFRTLAAILTAEEYAAVKAALTAQAAGNVVLADMLAMLAMPGDENGNGGGIDFGAAGTRATIELLAQAGGALATAAAKMLAYAVDLISRAEELGLPPVGPHHVEYARSL